jgi:hypothetical protein
MEQSREDLDKSPYFHDIIRCRRLIELTPPKMVDGVTGSGKSYCPLHKVVVWSRCGWQLRFHNGSYSKVYP